MAAALLNVEECIAVPKGQQAYIAFSKTVKDQYPQLERQIEFLSALIVAGSANCVSDEVKRIHGQFFEGGEDFGVSEFNLNMMANTVKGFAVVKVFDGARKVRPARWLDEARN